MTPDLALLRDAVAVPDATASAAGRPARARLGALNRTHAGWALAPEERIVWQGRPAIDALATRALHVPLVAAYFGALAVWGLLDALAGRAGYDAAVMPLATGLLVLGILLAIAAGIARTTTYLVTTDRIILRYGAAVPRSLSIPFRQVRALSVSVGRGGKGDIALALRGTTRVPVLKLWPHVRPWRLVRAEPTLRAIPGAALVATRLARRLNEARAAATTP